MISRSSTSIDHLKRFQDLLLNENYDELKKLSNFSQFVNVRFLNGLYPLHQLILQDASTTLIELMIQKGADINAGDVDGNTPLHYAIELESFEQVNTLTTYTTLHINQFNKLGYSPLHRCIEKDEIENFEILQLLLHLYRTSNLSIDEPNNRGDTALHIACLEGKMTFVQLLLDYEASVHTTNHRLSTPLFSALYASHFRIASELLKKGAFVAIMNAYGDTPLKLAAVHGKGEFVVELLSYLFGETQDLKIIRFHLSKLKVGLSKLHTKIGNTDDWFYSFI
jgi:uncharacterized protein